jgi:AsmA protein
MPHRAVLFVSLLCLALVATAVAPWTVSTGAMADAVAGQLREVYGLDLRVGGRSTVAFLPVPRVKFEEIELSTVDGTAIARGGQLRGELRILPLLTGRLQLAELSLTGTTITAASKDPWTGPAKRVRARLGERAPPLHIRRLILTGATVTLPDPVDGSEAVLRNVDVLANWPRSDGPLDLVASLRWRGEPVKVTLAGLEPGALLSGELNRVSADVESPLGRLNLAGEVQTGADWRASGRCAFSTPSAREFLRWTRLGVPLGPLLAATALDGDFTASRNGVAWPAMRLTLGTDRLDGALAARFDGPRPRITGTLAAETLDLTQQAGAVAPLRTSWGSWSAERLDLNGLTEALDLDLRVSATHARFGAVKLTDMAANVLVKAGRVEASLARAGLHRGDVKGRASLASAPSGVNVKLHGSFERVDVGALLADLGQARWLSGSGHGQIALEGAGGSPAEFARRIQGRATLAVGGGELLGASLVETLRRVDRRPLSTALDWKGGRTAFDHAHVALAVGDGTAEVTEGGFVSAALRGVLRGRASLADRSLAMKAEIGRAEAPRADAVRAFLPGPTPAAATGPSIGFDLLGSWDDITVTPDVRTLIERSGAAQQLLPEELRPPLRREAVPLIALDQ